MSMIAAVLAVACCTAPAPHDPGLSTLRVVREPGAVVVHAAFANADFAAAVGIDPDGDGFLTAGELAAAVPQLRREVGPAFTLAGRSPVALSAAIAENDDVELALRFPAGADGVLDVGLLERLSRGHRCYAAVIGDGDSILADALLSPGTRTFALPDIAAPPSGFAQAWLFFVLGIEHILLGFDHLAFLLALLAAGITFGRALATITAFTVAHSLTLIGASVGLVGLPSLLVEAIIAGSIVWVAAANLLSRTAEAPHRWPLAFGFGLVHGFGFAGVLADLEIGSSTAIAPLLTFNLGVEVGQLLFAAVVVPVLWLLGLTVHRARARVLLSVFVGVAGLFWLGERVLG